MFTKLLLLFILTPIVELILLIQLGQVIGTLPTIALIIFTGALGAVLARRQGVQVLARLRGEFKAGRLPAEPIFDGVMVLVAAAVLMTPGVLTDIFGFLCLIPVTRRAIKGLVWTRLQRAFRTNPIFTAVHTGARVQTEPEDVIIIDPSDYTTHHSQAATGSGNQQDQ